MNFFSFLTGAFIAGAIQGFALGSFGVFEDSAVYFSLYKNVQDLGVYEGIRTFMIQTSKFEPLIILLFALESDLSGGLLSEYWFLFVNMTLLNVMVAMAMFTLIDKNARVGALLAMGFIVVSGYLVFSKQLYVWRSVIGFVFFILFIENSSWKRWIWGVVACLAHMSFIMFIFLLWIIEKTFNSQKKYLLIVLSIGMFGAVFIVEYLPNFFEFMVGGGDISVFLSEGGAHTINAWGGNFFSFIILLLVHKEFIIDEKLRQLYFFCFLTIIASLVAYENYQLMLRLTVPASLAVGFLPFLINKKNLRFKFARLCVWLSVIPTIRLLMMLGTGRFLN